MEGGTAFDYNEEPFLGKPTPRVSSNFSRPVDQSPFFMVREHTGRRVTTLSPRHHRRKAEIGSQIRVSF